MIWAVVLGAGESKRIGEPKLLLPCGEKTMIETVIEKALDSRVDKTLVVLGSHWRRIGRIVKAYDVHVAVNPRFREGMLSSVQRGISALPRPSRAAVIVLADQPGLSARVIDSLISAYCRKKKGLVVPVYRNKRGHPLLIDLKYRQEIGQLDPRIGLRQLLQQHPEDLLEVRVSTPAVLNDIDTIQDYRRSGAGKSRPRL
ncbi:MAG: nucleotidyltransferase family protein [Clostridiales bacterium]|nr:nucleotidyltransferase family protein [Clostridiales bacterium]